MAVPVGPQRLVEELQLMIAAPSIITPGTKPGQVHHEAFGLTKSRWMTEKAR
jgi:hypothetical protein